MLRHAVIAAVFAVAALPAAADVHPTLQPTRDVAVQYRVSGAEGRESEVKIYYTANAQRMRIEPSGRPGYMIVDRGARKMDLVMPAQHMYMDVPYDPQKVMNFDASGAQFTRNGSASVAGVRCTQYDVKGREHSGQVCVTEDGVLLRARSTDRQDNSRLEATSVRYGPQPASLFVPPADFQRLDPAHMPQMNGMGHAPH